MWGVGGSILSDFQNGNFRYGGLGELQTHLPDENSSFGLSALRGGGATEPSDLTLHP